MSQLKVDTIRHTGASSDNIELDNSGRVGINEDSSLMSNGTLTIKFGTDKHMGFNSGQGELGSMPGLVAYKDNGSLQDIGIRGDNIRFATGSAERARFTDDGLCLGGTGSANALDDYEEGTFTVAMNFHGSGSSGSISLYSDQDLLSYVKIGRVVYIAGRVRIQTKSGGAGTDTSIGDLPFAAASATEEENAGVLQCYTYGTDFANDDYNNPWISVDPGSNKGYFYVTRNNASWSPIAPSQWADGDYILVNGHYFV